MKNKTLAAWLALAGGTIGLHRFYLYGLRDVLGWLLPIPTALGLYGIERVRLYGLDDPWSWALVPVLGFTFAGCALMGIIYGLTSPEKWNARFNPQAPPQAPSGSTNWFTIAAVVLALALGTISLMSGIVYGFEKYFNYQVDEGRKISQ